MELSLEEFIYKLHKENSFFEKKDSLKIMYGFSYNNFKDLLKNNIIFIKNAKISEKKENIICFLGDFEDFKNSIYFTKIALYTNIDNVFTSKEGTKIFYSDIKEIELQDTLNIILKTGEIYKISNLWKSESIVKFLNYTSNYVENEEDSKNNITQNIIKDKHDDLKDTKPKNNINENSLKRIKAEKSKLDIETASEITYSNISIASSNYGTTKFNGSRGYGFAAERANHLYDILTGKESIILGDDNVLNGPDRMVNGKAIQTKYCQDGRTCIQECFSNGKFRYMNSDGTPMQIEVPLDKYEDAVNAMKRRIERGEIPNVTNPEDAKKIVRKGIFTYEQAKNIAKAGTVESIIFDSVTGAVIATTSFGISSCLTFAVLMWNGEDFDVALKNATYCGLKVGGTAFMTTILTNQITKMGAEKAIIGGTNKLVKLLGPKATSILANAFRSGKNIYGAAATRNLSKLLSGNILTAGVSIVVLSTVDIINIFRGRISGAQLFKNIANTTSTVAGGTIGWMGGTAVGTKVGAMVGSAIPVLGTIAGAGVGAVVGGVLGSFKAGKAAGKVSNKVLSNFIEDDVNKMIQIIESEFSNLSIDYLLNREEAEKVIDNLRENLTENTLKDMFSKNNKKRFARNLMIPCIEKIVKNRKKIKLPTEKEMCQGIKSILEEMADNISN